MLLKKFFCDLSVQYCSVTQTHVKAKKQGHRHGKLQGTIS